MTLDLSPLKKRLRKKSGEEESVWPSLTLTLYCDAPPPSLGPFAAVLLRRYVESIPQDALRSSVIRGDVGPLTSQRISRDLKRLEKQTKTDQLCRIVYSSSERGQPGDHGCYLLLLDTTDQGLVGPLETSVFRFEFPWASAEGGRADQMASLFTSLSECVPFVCGTAGFGFSYWNADRFAADQVLSMLPRYIGFDHSDVDANGMRGKTPCASWLTFLNRELVEQLGGVSSLQGHLPAQAVQALEGGICVRAAEHPPVGDVNRGAEDIGALPSIARWMSPLRFRASSFGGSQVDIDISAWLERFDSRQDCPWSNRP